MKTKPTVPAVFGHHRIPHHYFVTPRQSHLPYGYFDRWRWLKLDVHDVLWVFVVVCFIVGLLVAR